MNSNTQYVLELTLFCSYIPKIHQNNGHYMDWTTYLAEDPFMAYKGKIPNGPTNKFSEVPAGQLVPGKKVYHEFFIFFSHHINIFILKNNRRIR